MLTFAVLAGLSGCAPSDEQLACEELLDAWIARSCEPITREQAGDDLFFKSDPCNNLPSHPFRDVDGLRAECIPMLRDLPCDTALLPAACSGQIQ